MKHTSIKNRIWYILKTVVDFRAWIYFFTAIVIKLYE